MSLKKIKFKKYWVISTVVPTNYPDKQVFRTQQIVRAKSAEKAIDIYYERDNWWALKHNHIVVKVEQLEPIVKLADGKEEENEETRN
jgi:hypothetical protein